jgi:hypothetical protein
VDYGKKIALYFKKAEFLKELEELENEKMGISKEKLEQKREELKERFKKLF